MVILGSTGSVGEQAVDVALSHGVRVHALSADKSVGKVEAQARRLCPEFCIMNDEAAARELKIALADTDIKVLQGVDGIAQMLSELKSDNPNGIVVENSILGKAGLEPTVKVLEAGYPLALANKESLVVGGEIVMPLAKKQGITILPVDSEHCAIFQCLRAGEHDEIKKILLTASGGPFFGYDSSALRDVTLQDTLKHPTWNMGAKITVDSATLMNKGFEVIEAVHLFEVTPSQIEVVVHRESIIHSMVEYIDNSVIAQMSVPDMRHCVQYALTHPRRTTAENTIPALDLFAKGKLTFMRPDTEVFTLLSLAYSCIDRGGALPCALNAANEVAVAAFLNEKIPFWKISDVVEKAVGYMNGRGACDVHTLDGILEVDADTRAYTQQLL
ncbi:MAG: 1-deoxy-D-xylulose-5-phosphate reductoisomerase [Ruminococcaceae bacterium]|nr:1-deoxy-D-xylulose-5-phosphate reductoisomerase [Oscillospiraceae bacterium]